MKSYNEQGFPVTPGASTSTTDAVSGTVTGTFGGGVFDAQTAGKNVGTKTSTAGAAPTHDVWRLGRLAMVGAVAAVVERLL